MVLKTGLLDKRGWTGIALLAEEREEGDSSQVVDLHDQQAMTFSTFSNHYFIQSSIKAS
jgi:hypothetical protein